MSSESQNEVLNHEKEILRNELDNIMLELNKVKMNNSN